MWPACRVHGRHGLPSLGWVGTKLQFTSFSSFITCLVICLGLHPALNQKLKSPLRSFIGKTSSLWALPPPHCLGLHYHHLPLTMWRKGFTTAPAHSAKNIEVFGLGLNLLEFL